MKKFVTGALCLSLATILLAAGPSNPVAAASGSDFKPGRIIDDAVFNNKGAMTVDQIQAFLNSKVTCDRNGTKTSEFGGGTRAQYGTAHGNPPPYTCLPDYIENPSTGENNLDGRGVPAGGYSAAQIIWQAGQDYNVNPQVLIVLIQREQGLVTDEWPFDVQYASATGYACPDVGPDHSIVCQGYFGFANQVYAAAWQFQHYAQNPNQFNYVANANNTIQWSPQPSCGTSVVFIENQSTASLYNYAPYRPNDAALANLYGTGDACSSYANRNFWRYFTDWFGSTLINDPFGWDVIKTADDGRWWLVVGRTKRYIPSSALYYDWGLDKKPVRTVSQAEFDGYSTLPDLERLGWFGDRYYFIDGGKKYWLSTDQLLNAWGQYYKRPYASAAFTLIANMPDGGEATFYAAQTTENKIAFLDSGNKYSFPITEADRWRANPIFLSSDGYDNYLGTGASLDYHVSINGLKFLVDNGRLLDVTNPVVQRAYGIAGATYVPIPGSVSVFMRSELAWPTVVQDGTPHWYRLLGGKKYFLMTMPIAKTWGGNTATVISAKLFDSFTTSSAPLVAIVHEPVADAYYLVDDGTRHKLTGVMLDALQGGGVTYPDVDATSINDLANGADISSPLLRNRDQGHVYTIVGGMTYHVPTLDVLNALGSPRRWQPVDVSADATYSLSPGFVPVNMFFTNGGTTYFMQDGYAFPISAGAVADWTGSTTPKAYPAPNFSGRFNVLGTPLTQKVNELGHDLVASGGTLVDISQYNDAYDDGSAWTSLVAFGMPRAGGGTYIVRSSDASDGRLWLINHGKKFYIATLEQLSAYSKGFQIPITTLSPTALALFTTDAANPSLLTVSQNTGFKLLESDGSFYSFPNSDTAVNFIGSNRIENVSQSIANGFGRERSAITRLIRDPSGKVYWVENGQKRWILNETALNPYRATPITNVSQAVANWLPSGSNIQ